MSVTISDLLKLPALQRAKVVAGHGGIEKIISSVSVLETVDHLIIDDYAYKQDNLGGSEIVITGFLNARDDAEVQLQIIRQLMTSGEAGLIWYYIGVFVAEIPQEIINYANANDFVIICMPSNQHNLRYGDAINDIMTAIIHDRDGNDNLTVTLLDTIARLPEKQRNVGTMVRLISERLHISIVLLNAQLMPLYEAAWPGECTGFHQNITRNTLIESENSIISFPQIPGSWIRTIRIGAEFANYYLCCVSVGPHLSDDNIEQTAETIRLAINIWEKEKESAVISELVKAILEDEPLKMRSLAALFHIDVASIHNMWVFHGECLTESHARQLTQLASMYCETTFADQYGKDIVLFVGALEYNADMLQIFRAAKELLPENIHASLFMNLNTTMDVRSAYILNEEALEDTVKIMPGREYYTAGDLRFAKTCRDVISGGEEKIRSCLSALEPVSKTRDTENMIETLSAYLLDAGCSVSRTAEILFVHKNTVKYRIGILSNLVGFSIGSMPASLDLYTAVAVTRLMQSNLLEQ